MGMPVTFFFGGPAEGQVVAIVKADLAVVPISVVEENRQEGQDGRSIVSYVR